MRFLGPDWLAAVDEALGSDPAVRAATATSSLRLLQVVVGGPDGDVAYLVTVDGGSVRVLPCAPDEAAQVALATDWDTAVALHRGELAPHDAFTTGRLVVRGDITALRTEAPALAGLDAAFARVRTATTF